MRSLVITNKPVYPSVGGAALRNWQTINMMMRLGEVATFSVVSSAMNWGEEPPGVAISRHHVPGRMRPSLRRRIERRLWWVRPHGHKWADIFYHRDVEQDLDCVLREFDPDVVIVEELWLHSYRKVIQRSGRPWIYDAHNVELTLQPSRLLRSKVQAIERSMVSTATQIWTCSAHDQDLLRRYYDRHTNVQLIPNTVDVGQYRDERFDDPGPGWDGQSNTGPTLVYTSTFSYRPNAVAAQVLIDELYPRIKSEYPGCRLALVGNRPTQQMLDAAHRDAGIVVTGRVPDVRPYLATADVVVVPLMDGGGTRLKILEGFAARRPVVSTRKGAEGLDATDGVHLLIRDGVDELAAAIKQLFMYADQRTALVRNAYDLVKSRYSWEALYPQVEEAVVDVLSCRVGKSGIRDQQMNTVVRKS